MARFTGTNTEGHGPARLAGLDEAFAEAVASEERRTGRALDPADMADGRVLDALAERILAGGERGLLTQLHGLAG